MANYTPEEARSNVRIKLITVTPRESAKIDKQIRYQARKERRHTKLVK